MDRPLSYVIRRIAMLYEARAGVTAIEFALIAPVLLLMVMGIMELGTVMYVSTVMESAIINTARLGKTGYTADGISREQTLKNMLADRTSGLINMDNLTITNTVYASWDSVGDAEPFQDANSNGTFDSGEQYDDINGNGQRDTDMGAAGLGDANDVVVYTVSYPWPITTPVIGYLMGIGSGGTYTISARAVVKNEPYDVE